MSSNRIQVNRKQTGNPVLKAITRCPWAFADIEPDFVVGRTACALFLSLRYHALNPNYIYDRINKLGDQYDLRILLTIVDHVEHNAYLKELSKLCIRCNLTLMLCWAPEDAAMYLEKYKLSEDKPADLTMEKPTSYEYEDALDQYMIDALTECRAINRTDAASIVSLFDKFTRIAAATPEELALCPGVGMSKAQRLYNLLHKPMKRGGDAAGTSRSSQQKSGSQTTFSQQEPEIEYEVEPRRDDAAAADHKDDDEFEDDEEAEISNPVARSLGGTSQDEESDDNKTS